MNKTSASIIAIQRASLLANIPKDRTIRKWISAAINTLTKPAELTLRIVNAAESRNLNSAFRGKDYATNVLTFVYNEPNSKALQGDIVLCAQVINREAREQGKPINAHYAHLIVHGVLHLAGFDHEIEKDAKKMEALEAKIVMGLGFLHPYDVVASSEKLNSMENKNR
jgi:probable rRNA maturation factor